MSNEPEEPDEEESDDIETDAIENVYGARAKFTELRRYMSLEMARNFGVPAKEAIKTAGDIERFLKGQYPREVK